MTEAEKCGIEVLKRFGSIATLGLWSEDYDPLRAWVPGGPLTKVDQKSSRDVKVYVLLAREVLKRLGVSSRFMPDLEGSARFALYSEPTARLGSCFTVLSYGVPAKGGLSSWSLAKVRVLLSKGQDFYVFYHNSLGEKLTLILPAKLVLQMLPLLEREVEDEYPRVS